MPRLYIPYANDSGGDPIDLCEECWEAYVVCGEAQELMRALKCDEERCVAALEDLSEAGITTDGDDHPPYEGEEYDCDICRVRLTAADN